MTDSFRSYTGGVPKVGGEVGDGVRKKDNLLMEFQQQKTGSVLCRAHTTLHSYLLSVS